MFAHSSLDDVTAVAFLAFVNDNLEALINPEDILDTQNYQAIENRISALAQGAGDAKRVDRLATICTRLFLYMGQPNYKPKPQHQKHLVSFLMHADLPNDLRFSLHKDLTGLRSEVSDLLRDPELAKMILEGM